MCNAVAALEGVSKEASLAMARWLARRGARTWLDISQLLSNRRAFDRACDDTEEEVTMLCRTRLADSL